MTFKIDFSSQATKFIRNLPNDFKKRVKKKFKEIVAEPFRYLEHFEWENCYKTRIGEYRGLIDVDFDKRFIC